MKVPNPPGNGKDTAKSKGVVGDYESEGSWRLAPMGPLGLGDCKGGWIQRGIDYYTRRKQGGTGLIITGVTFSDCKVETQSLPNVPNRKSSKRGERRQRRYF